jgi:hypothetical protein
MEDAIKVAREGLKTALAERRNLEPLLDECYRLTMPQRRLFSSDRDGTEADAELYDETGVVGAHEGASRIHAGVVPAYSHFAGLEGDATVPRESIDAVNADLAEIQEFMFDVIWGSNFSPEAFEMIQDMMISTGIMLVEASDHGIITHKALPPTECATLAGPTGEITELYRQRKVRAKHLPGMYGSEISAGAAKLAREDGDKAINLVDAITWDPVTETARQVSFVDEGDHLLKDRTWLGYGAKPFVALRFNTVSGESAGRGPVMNALAAMKTANTVVEFVLQHAALTMVPPFHYDDDGSLPIGDLQMLPGVGIPRAPGTRGIEPIAMGGSGFNVSDIILADQRTNIKRALFNDMLSDPNKTPATAYEVSERMADLAHRMGAPAARIHFDFIQPYARRVLWLLEERGLITLPVENGRAVRVRATSPLAKAQESQDVQSLVRYHQISAGVFGPQLAALQYDEVKMMPWLRDRMSVPSMLFLPPAEAQKRVAQMSQQMVAAQGGQPPGPPQPGGPPQ